MPSFLTLLLTTVQQNSSEVFIKFRLTTVRTALLYEGRRLAKPGARPRATPTPLRTPPRRGRQRHIPSRSEEEERNGPGRPDPTQHGTAPLSGRPPAAAGWFAPRTTCSPRRVAGPGGAARAAPPALAPPPPAPAAPFASAAAHEASWLAGPTGPSARPLDAPCGPPPANDGGGRRAQGLPGRGGVWVGAEPPQPPAGPASGRPRPRCPRSCCSLCQDGRRRWRGVRVAVAHAGAHAWYAVAGR